MTRVDFYILGDTAEDTRLDLICKLAEKAVSHGQKVFIFDDTMDRLKLLDERLWYFRPLSFVAHRLVDDASTDAQEDEPVILSTAEPVGHRDVLLNLHPAVPTFFSRFGRTLEVVNRDPEIQKKGRERYLFYKQRGYPLQHHPVT